MVNRYIEIRQGEGAANASINRELSALKRMFQLLINDRMLGRKPKIKLLEENNARQGFLDHDDFEKLRDNLPDYLKDPVEFLYRSGWRVSEMRALEWRDVDLPNRVVRLRPELSKNKAGRLLPLRGELGEIFARAKELRKLDCMRVFHDDGRPIGDFRKAWKKALKEAELGPLLVHDLRRTAVRNLLASGVREKVAMQLTGHKTRTIFDRYSIVDDNDLAGAIDQLQNHLKAVRTVRDTGKAKA
jgi:integrase